MDNGVDSNTAIVDNDASSTRFGFKAQEQLENGLVVSALLELQSESNSSSSISFDDDSNEESNKISERHSRIGLGTKYGTFLIGKTSDSMDGISEVDLGGVQDVMYSDITAIGGSATFVEADGTDTTVKVSDLYANFDGSRTNLVRYDSPVLAGFSTSASVSSGGDLAMSAKYSGKIDRFKVKSSLGYKQHEASSSDVDTDMVATVSALCEESRIGVTASYGERSFDDSARDDASYSYYKVSYLPLESNFEYAVDYSSTKHAAAANQGKVESYGVGTQYKIAEGVTTSAMYRELQADDAVANAEDMKFITAGLKVKF